MLNTQLVLEEIKKTLDRLNRKTDSLNNQYDLPLLLESTPMEIKILVLHYQYALDQITLLYRAINIDNDNEQSE